MMLWAWWKIYPDGRESREELSGHSEETLRFVLGKCKLPGARKGVERELYTLLRWGLWALRKAGEKAGRCAPSTPEMIRVMKEVYALGVYYHDVGKALERFQEREPGELEAVKALCDYYYHNPPVDVEEIRAARLDWVLIVDVDTLSARILRPEVYVRLAGGFLAKVAHGAA